jgi:hypothetical protein
LTVQVTLGGDDGTGILLVDRARVSRHDIAVPVFGLFALWRAMRATAPRACFGTGLLAGLSSLSHLYGVFWLPILLLLTLARFRRNLRAAGWRPQPGLLHAELPVRGRSTHGSVAPVPDVTRKPGTRFGHELLHVDDILIKRAAGRTVFFQQRRDVTVDEHGGGSDAAQ